MGVEGRAARFLLRLGEEVVELLEFFAPGRPYPNDVAASDILFQHLAIVVSDMDAAYERLSARPAGARSRAAVRSACPGRREV